MGVGGAPDRDADAALHRQAGADHGGVVVGLALLGLGVGGEARVADVDLGVGDVEVLGGEGVEHRGQRLLAARLADGEVALEADAVDGGPAAPDQIDNPERRLLLVARLLDVEVVVVQLGHRVRCRGGLEGDGDPIGAQHPVEHRVPEGPVVVERLVDHVPGVAFALVVARDVADVRFDDAGERVAVPISR